jgi:N-acetylglucosamine-6-phosphate deacetylase
MLYIDQVKIYAPDRVIEGAAVWVDGQRITAVGQANQMSPPANTRYINGQGLTLVPGFIDLQLNGAFGHDFTHDPETIWPAATGLPRYGVTAFLPTIVTSPLETIALAQAVLAAGPPAGFIGSYPLGLHLEGPFLNPARKGAHNLDYMRRPDPEIAAGWSPQAAVRMVTLAPELSGAAAVIEKLKQQGVVVSAGHSLAGEEEMKEAVTAGLSYATHLFNAMPAIHHRQPGLVAAALADHRVVIGLIPDGIHVHPLLVDLVWRLTGPGRLNLVTDAMAALGMPPGRYRLAGFEAVVNETQAALPDGTLAGSILPLDQALRNLMAFTSCTLAEALPTVTTTPAALLGLEGTIGKITPGCLADMVLITADCEVAVTIARGKIVYDKKGLDDNGNSFIPGNT